MNSLEKPDEDDTEVQYTVAHNVDSKKRTIDIDSGSSSAAVLGRMHFTDFLLSKVLLKGLRRAGFLHPSPIQAKAIPLGKCGLDLVLQAKAGTGKTCVFAVLALDLLDVTRMQVQVLVIAPTREIAVQSRDVIGTLAHFMPAVHCYACIGGIPIGEDIKHLKQSHIVIGTAGRLKYVIESGYLDTRFIRLFVLDEADALFAQKSQPDINWIYSSLPKSKQVILLSATYPDELMTHLAKYMQAPTFLRLDVSHVALLGVKQFYCTVSAADPLAMIFTKKAEIVVHILSSVQFHQCIIFSNYHASAQNLSEVLTKLGWPAIFMSAKLSQTERLEAYDKLKHYHCRVLVSTDLTSRGIDAENVNLVINMEIPWEYETYLHRIGRAGRYGSYGAAISIADDGKELQLLNKIKNLANLSILQLPEPIPADLSSEDVDDVTCGEVKSSSDYHSILRPWSVTLSNSLNDAFLSSWQQQSNNNNNSSSKPGSGDALISTGQFSIAGETTDLFDQHKASQQHSDSLDFLSNALAMFHLHPDAELLPSREDCCQQDKSILWATPEDIDRLLLPSCKAPQQWPDHSGGNRVPKKKTSKRKSQSRPAHHHQLLMQQYKQLKQLAAEYRRQYEMCDAQVRYYTPRQGCAAAATPLHPPLPFSFFSK